MKLWQSPFYIVFTCLFFLDQLKRALVKFHCNFFSYFRSVLFLVLKAKAFLSQPLIPPIIKQSVHIMTFRKKVTITNTFIALQLYDWIVS